MGAGKSTVGRLISKSIDWPFFDTDELIEKDEYLQKIYYGKEILNDLEKQLKKNKSLQKTLADPEKKEARANREILKSLYASVKAMDQHIGFFFLTGVSKFSKVSIFSDCNRLLTVFQKKRIN